MAQPTQAGQEPKNVIGGFLQRLHSLFGMGDEDRMEGSDEYHARREGEELQQMGEDAEHQDTHADVEHPKLKVLMEKLKMGPQEDEEGEPAKGGYVGMMKK